ncbi:CKAP2 protein, partial [Sakesphorus luctuosus]|nr:CKAP2 protein [Sakesphorus luctuosus]
MAVRASSQLPVSRRSEPAFREQRRQKVEEYLSRKKTFSGVPIQVNQTSISSRTRRTTSNKLQDNLQLSKSPKPEMENKENDDKLSWDKSSVSSEKNVALNSSTIPLTSYVPEANWNLDGEASKAKGTEVKSQHVSFSKAFLEIKRIREKQMIAEKQNASVNLPKKPALGKYRGRVIQSKINSFRKAVKTEGDKSSLPDKKLLPSATKQAANSSSTKSCGAVLKTIKVTNNAKSVKTNGVLPLHSKPPEKAAVHSQSGLKKQQLAVAAAPRKVTVQKLVGGRGPQPPKAASSNPDHRVQGVKKCVDFCEGARPEAPAKSISVVTKPGQNSKANGNRKSLLPKETAEERRARLDQWRASRGRVMRRPPIYALMGSQSKSEQEFYSADALEQSEKVNKTLSECLQLTEQGCHGDDVRAMLEDLMQSIPGVKRLAKFWICWMRLEQMGPLEKLLTVYEEAISAGARPKEELRHMLIDTMKNNESLFKSENGASVIDAHVSELVEVIKEANSSVEPVQETFKDFCSDDVQNTESDNKKAEASSEAIEKEETDLDLKPREEILPKKNKKRKAREHKKKKGKCETEQNEDGIKDTAQAFNSPEKGNDASCSLKYNPPITPHLERKDDFSDLFVYFNFFSFQSLKTPLRYSQRLRERMCKLSDTAKDQDPCVSSLEQLGELESKATVFIHEQSNAFQETSAEIE